MQLKHGIVNSTSGNPTIDEIMWARESGSEISLSCHDIGRVFFRVQTIRALGSAGVRIEGSARFDEKTIPNAIAFYNPHPSDEALHAGWVELNN